MSHVLNLLDRAPFDSKLIVTIVTAVLARVALEAGISDDDTVQTLIPLVAAAVAGYLTPNEGSILRGHGADDGNPLLPSDEAVEGEAT